MKDKQTRLSHLARYEIRALKSTLRDSEKECLSKALHDSAPPKDLYGFITGHHNTDRALSLIRQCAPFMFPANEIETLNVSVETWQKKILTLEFGSEPEEQVRLFWSPLELILLRATHNEILGIISYLTGETRGLIQFDLEYWDFQGPILIKETVCK